jgi:hypothetical protein
MDDLVIVARPADGGPVVLAPTARLVWSALEDWCCRADLDLVVAAAYPEIDATEREEALTAIIEILTAEGLLERA